MYLKDRLRDQDAQEVIAEGNESVEAAVVGSFERSSICLCVEQDGAVSALFGIVPDSTLGPTARVWFLGAEELKKIKKTFVRESRKFIKYFLNLYPIIWNTVDIRYKATISWLTSCGAEFEPYSDEFVIFQIRRT